MLIKVNSLLELQVHLATRFNTSSITILAAEDTHTSISLTTVKNLLDSEGPRYSVVLISSFQQLQRQLQTLETEPDTVDSVIVLNCGSVSDIKKVCRFQQNVHCYVYDDKPIRHEEGLIGSSRKDLGTSPESEGLAVGTLFLSEEDSAEEPKSLKRGREGEVEHSPKRIKRDDSQVFRHELTVRDPTLISEPGSDLNPLETQDKVEFDLCKFERLMRSLAVREFFSSDDSNSAESEELDQDELEDWFLGVIKNSDRATAIQAFETFGDYLCGLDESMRTEDLWAKVIDLLTASFPDSFEVAKTLSKMGNKYEEESCLETNHSEECYEAALKIYKEHFPDAIERAKTALSLADYYLSQEDSISDSGLDKSSELEVEVEELYLDALRIYKKLNLNSYDIAVVLEKLGSYYLDSQRYDEAELRLKAALETRSLNNNYTDYILRSLRCVYSGDFGMSEE